MNAAIRTVLLGLVLSTATASAATREEVLVRARSFANHPWRMTSNNARATCSSPYRSVYLPGDYRGLPYDWGGYMSVFQFDQRILQGQGAGSYPGDGILSCTAGVDCSGFVSQAWGSTHTTTSGMSTITNPLTGVGQLVTGDVMNQAGYHVSLYSHRLASGDPVWIEAIGYNVHVNATGGWSAVDGFSPLRHKQITGTTAPNTLGTTTNPIVIGSLPYQDTRDTSQSAVDFLDGCNADATKNESGPEFVYKLVVDRPGTLTVSVTDDASTDIDVHLYEQLNTTSCVKRHDATLTHAVGCGTYYVVADTFVTSAGAAKVGRYTLNVSLAASGAACGSSGPPSWSFAGEPGDACAYPDNENLPFCNENSGSETCIYTSGRNSVSFCSHACARNADCADIAGGCCGELSGGERYCMTAAFCGSSGQPDGGTSSGGGIDAGFGDPGADGGIPTPPDAGHTTPDAGTSTPDAGPSTPDAGTTTPDAGHSTPDAGTSTPDAGHSTPDAGGHTTPDAGPSTRDAGTEQRRDAGGTDGDEQPAPMPTDEGCGCSTGSGVGLAWLAMIVRRRRRPTR